MGSSGLPGGKLGRITIPRHKPIAIYDLGDEIATELAPISEANRELWWKPLSAIFIEIAGGYDPEPADYLGHMCIMFVDQPVVDVYWFSVTNSGARR